MKTSKPISTISYNSVDFLLDKLNRLKYMRVIAYYEFIVHLPDKDDKKEHIHLYIEPNKIIDTEEFASRFLEDEDTHLDYVDSNDKLQKPPLKCICFRSSKFGDWYWYALHDKGYLKSKMLERNVFYSDSDIFTSDVDTHRYLVLDNPLSKYCFMGDDTIREYVFNCVSEGKDIGYIMKNARIPIGKTQSVISFYHAINCTFNPNSYSRSDVRSQIKKDITKYKEVPFKELPFKDELF